LQKILALILLLLLISGCSGLYLARLEMLSPAPSDDLNFSDENIRIAFAPYITESLDFKVENKSEEPLEIIWEDAYFTNPQGWKMELILLENREISLATETPAPTRLSPGEILKDRLVPRENIYYHTQAREWRIFNIIPTETEKISIVRQFDGEIISLLLPIRRGEKTENYSFEFRVNLRPFGRPDQPPEF